MKLQKKFYSNYCWWRIRKLSDISDVLKSGADKVLINTAAIKNPNFIYDAAREFGSSTIVVALEAIAQNGDYTAFFDNGREYTGLNVKNGKRIRVSRCRGNGFNFSR